MVGRTGYGEAMGNSDHSARRHYSVPGMYMLDIDNPAMRLPTQAKSALKPPETPVLHTRRLVVRGFQKGDIEPFAAMLANPRVGQFKGFPKGASLAQSWAGMANIIGHWSLRGFGLLAVECRESGDFVGCVGLIEPLSWPGPELTWTLKEEFWGRGLATEAATAVRDWVFSTLSVERIVSMIHPENFASVRVALKLGASYEHDVQLWGQSTNLYVIRRKAEPPSR